MLKTVTNDWLVLPGGSDISPSIYNKENYKSYVNAYSMRRDIDEMQDYNKAVKEGRPIFGICRGLQLISALNGLSLIQNMTHPMNHRVSAYNDKTGEYDTTLIVNNAHHQCVWTENVLETEDFKVYGHTSMSPYHEYQENQEIECKFEPEIIYFPKTRAIGVQFHPEWMNYSDPQHKQTLDYLDTLINKLF